jgi:hypothetical protein
MSRIKSDSVKSGRKPNGEPIRLRDEASPPRVLAQLHRSG